MKHEPVRRAIAATRTAATTEPQGIKSVKDRYARGGVLFLIRASSLLILVGTSLLFSQIHQVDWHLCAALCVCLLVAVLVILVQLRRGSGPSVKF